MSRSAVSREPRAPGLGLALAVLTGVIAFVGFGVLKLGIAPHIPLAAGTTLVSIVAVAILHEKWENVEASMVSAIAAAMPALLILIVVGMLAGIWIQAGIVPGLIYYGLSILSPSIFLVATLLICSIVSLATGTSWGTTGTVGIALMGVAAGIGIPPALTAGVILSGAYFGDKMSPLSDTTNLAPAVSGANLFDHIKAMLWTTGPSYVIVLVILAVLGMRYAGKSMNASELEAIKVLLAAEFHISPTCLIPPLIVMACCVFKVPALPGIASGVAAGLVMAAFQGIGLADTLNALQAGYKPVLSAAIGSSADAAGVSKLLAENGITSLTPELAKKAGEVLSSLLTRGGVDSVLYSLSLMLFALALGGAMERAGIMEALLKEILKHVQRIGGLITAVIASCFLTNMFLADQYLAIVIPGRMFKGAFEKKGLAPRMLSRCLEDSGTLTSPLVPWGTCGVYQSSVLGVPTLAYAPYAFLNILNPLFAILLTYLGIGVYKRENGEDTLMSRSEAVKPFPAEVVQQAVS